MQIIMHAVSCKHSNMMVLWLLYVVKFKTKHIVGVQSKKPPHSHPSVLSSDLVYLLFSQ